MATNGASSPAIPPVVLDKTLYDLLLDEAIDGEKIETLCQLKPNSDLQYGDAVPMSNKYIIQSAQVESADDLAHLQLENCCHLLLFFTGRMNVMFVAAEGKTKDSTLSQQGIDENARRSFGVIQESQRPIITTHANVEDCLKNHDGSKIRWGFAMDFAEKLPHLFHPEHVYKLNSKRWLAECDLKSANDEIIDCHITSPAHKTKDGLWYYGGSGSDTLVEDEIERIREIVKKRPIPFVLKLTQSLSSVGTKVVQTEEDKTELLEEMTNYLRKYLPRVSEENAHLWTTALILSDFIPGDTMALNFFIRKDGSPIFLGACHQLSTGESGRQATAITYADQETLEKKYVKTLERIGKVLNQEGYHGPVGADIMENPDDGTLFTIDLNVRVPLSLVLYLLRGHFTKRGLETSIVYECIMLKISREELEQRFAKEFSEARIVLLGSTRLGEKEKWAYGVVVAGEDKKAIDELSDRILEFEAAGKVDV